MVKTTQQQGGDPQRWLEVWAREHKLEFDERVLHELRTIIDALYYLGSYDHWARPTAHHHQKVTEPKNMVVGKNTGTCQAA